MTNVRCAQRWSLKASIVVLASLIVFPALHTDAGEALAKGLVVTSPRVWLVGSLEKTCIISHGTTFSVRANISLVSLNGYSVLASRTVTLPPGGSKCAEVEVPSGISGSKANLLVEAESADSTSFYNFSKSAKVTLKTPQHMTFIETDKPLYKPGDTVRIRIMTLKGPDLLLLTDNIPLVYIEDPTRTRVMQWVNVSSVKGLSSLEMPLSDEPPLGEWTIRAFIEQRTESQTFLVKEYVLPKYEVSIEYPSYFTSQSSNTTWKACARYTYGQPVSGDITSKVCSLDSYIFDRHGRQCLATYSEKLKDGCAEFSFDSSSFDRNSHMNHFHFSENTRFDIFAEVKEHGTNVIRNTKLVVKKYPNEFHFTFLTDSPHYKPGLPFYGWGRVVFRDGTPAKGKPIKIQTTGNGRGNPIASFPDLELTTADDGRFQYVLPWNFTGQYLKSISQTASLTGVKDTSWARRDTTIGREIKPWFSPSNSFLQIEAFQKFVSCQSTMSLPVVFLTPLESLLTFHFQLIARGDIVHAGNLSVSSAAKDDLTGENSVYEFNITFFVTHRMSGKLMLLVFTILPNGETVADSLSISVEECFKNHVSMKFADKQKQPGHSTVLSIAADPNSLCSVLVVDKSVKLMAKTDNSVSKSKVSEILNKYDSSEEYFWDTNEGRHTENCGSVDKKANAYQSAEQILKDEDGVPYIRAPRRKRSRIKTHMSDFIDSKEAFASAGVKVLSDLTFVTKPCYKATIDLPYHSDYTTFRRYHSRPEEESEMQKGVLHRNFFPESWLWQLEFVGDAGTKDVSLEVPHTITEWVGSGFCSNTGTGLGISSAFTINAFQPFFVSFTVPYSVIRGERVSIPVSVFNYLDQCLKVTLYVEKTSAFKMNSKLSVRELMVCGHKTETITYNIEPVELGKINFTIRATSVAADKVETNSVEDQEITTAADIVTQVILVEVEGKEEELVKSAFVCAPGSGTWSMDLLNALIIPDSLRAHTAIIGDVMGPTLTGLESLLALPTGCGEQNMLNFAPNIFVMHYLQKTNDLTQAIKNTAIRYLETGYQRELTYRHADGSYSAFGSSDAKGSIWLTAFVVKSFAQAQPFIHIDPINLAKSIQWITSSQLKNGCFPEIGHVLHKEMKGGLANGRDSLAALTAYIVVALMEAKVSPQDPVILKAFKCLSRQDAQDMYTKSLMVYAYTMWNRSPTQRANLMQSLQAKAIIVDGMKHWSNKRDDSISSPASVEMTSYVLLSVVHNDDQRSIFEALPLVRWLTTQRNSRGGFTSTQDTVIALQALSQFAALVRGGGIDADTVITGTAWHHSASITNDNRLLLHKREGKTLPSQLHYNVSGTGCVLLQASIKYNTMNLSRESVEGPAFILSVHTPKTSECKKRGLKICTKYNRADNASNMAVISVKMVSGWIPDKESIKKLMNRADLKLKRYEIDTNVVQLYFEELNNKKEKCLMFHVEQNVVVSNIKPAVVHVYDYYQPSLSAHAKYSIASSCVATQETRVTEIEPLKSNNNTMSQKPLLTECPECDLQNPEEVKNRYCQAPFAYDVLVMNKTMIIQSQAHFSDSINKIIGYHLPSKCKCSALGKRNNVAAVLVLTKEVNLKKKINLLLDKDVTVIKGLEIKNLVRDAAAANTPVCP